MFRYLESTEWTYCVLIRACLGHVVCVYAHCYDHVFNRNNHMYAFHADMCISIYVVAWQRACSIVLHRCTHVCVHSYVFHVSSTCTATHFSHAHNIPFWTSAAGVRTCVCIHIFSRLRAHAQLRSWVTHTERHFGVQYRSINYQAHVRAAISTVFLACFADYCLFWWSMVSPLFCLFW